ncbi:MAG TPA: Gfo/Idh/MocA family oxidoreductase [Terriglobia bacterium]|nr:Gfo/Idh/MocA family oxidoreductase [Terriglobia bacterium]
MTDRPIRVAIVGAGVWGTQHARVYRSMDGVVLSAIVDSDRERANALAAEVGAAAFSDIDALTGAVDAVSLTAPTVDHASLGVRLLDRGMDTLVEKPIAATPAEARLLIDAAERGSRILQVGHVERFNPVVRLAIEVATRPQFFEIHRLAAFSPRSLDIDVVLDLMIHDLDIVLRLTRSPVREVRAVGIPVLSRKADIANARVEFESGCVANLTASRVSFEKVRKLRFFQPHDYISVDYASQTGSMVSLRMGNVVERKLDPPAAEPLKLELESFIDCVRARRKPDVTGQDGLDALELARSIVAAIEQRTV